MISKMLAMVKAIISGFVRFILTFFGGRLFGSNSEKQKQAENAIDSYRKAEKIDESKDLDANGLRDFFKRVRR